MQQQDTRFVVVVSNLPPVGYEMLIDTLLFGRQRGRVEWQGKSPYWMDDREVVYVVGIDLPWATHRGADEIQPDDVIEPDDFCLDCKRDCYAHQVCPNCGDCPACCYCEVREDESEIDWNDLSDEEQREIIAGDRADYGRDDR